MTAQDYRSERFKEIFKSLKEDFYNKNPRNNVNHSKLSASELFFDWVNGDHRFEPMMLSILLNPNADDVEKLVDLAFAEIADKIEADEMLSYEEFRTRNAA